MRSKGPNTSAVTLRAQRGTYPTPLLDWTYSPFVAAYFAFDHAKDYEKDSKVRIFILDGPSWNQSYEPVRSVSIRWHHFSIVEPIAVENERLVPQQALSSYATVDDIEGYIASKETEATKTFLQVIDLPASDRRVAMRDLAMMGVTAGSLFPGLDGACKELRERFCGPPHRE